MLKVRIKSFLRVSREEMMSAGRFPSLTARRVDLLERAMTNSMQYVDCVRLVSCMEKHCQLAVATALRGEDMTYGE